MIDQAILNELSAIAQNYETCDFEFAKKDGEECLRLNVGDGDITIMPDYLKTYLVIIDADGGYYSDTLERTSEINTFYFLHILANTVDYYKGYVNSFSMALKEACYKYRDTAMIKTPAGIKMLKEN